MQRDVVAQRAKMMIGVTVHAKVLFSEGASGRLSSHEINFRSLLNVEEEAILSPGGTQTICWLCAENEHTVWNFDGNNTRIGTYEIEIIGFKDSFIQYVKRDKGAGYVSGNWHDLSVAPERVRSDGGG